MIIVVGIEDDYLVVVVEWFGINYLVICRCGDDGGWCGCECDF